MLFRLIDGSIMTEGNMNDIHVIGKKGGNQPFNSRAVMAILSRLISGVILSLMFFQYFSSQGGGSAFETSRLWWEIALNLQLLSIGMMWFSYVDRISPVPGPLRRLQLIKCWLAILAVSTPFVVGFIAVLGNWFVEKPSPMVFVIIVGLAVAHLAVSLAVRLKIENYIWKREQIYSRRQRLAFFTPSIMFAALATACALVGDTIWFSFTPLFIFMQGSMPYVMEIIGVTEPEIYSGA